MLQVVALASGQRQETLLVRGYRHFPPFSANFGDAQVAELIGKLRQGIFLNAKV